MWGLSKGEMFLANISLKNLRKFYCEEKNSKAKFRLLAAIHRKKGKSLDDIAMLLEKPRRTVHGWLTRFQQRGISGKDSKKQSGRPPQLTLKQREELVKELERGPAHNRSGLWTTKEVKDLLKKKYNISFVSQHVWRILKSLGFSLQKPRKRHYMSASPEEIKQFKKKQGKKPNTIERKALLWARKMKRPLA